MVPPLASICSRQRWFDVFELLSIACHILHGPCPTLPGLYRLHLPVNMASQLACLMWELEWLRKYFSAIWVFVWEERNWDSLDLWERRPKAAFTKPSKPPSGSPGLCVTLLSKITLSPGPLSLSSVNSPFVHFPLFPRQPTLTKKVWLWRLFPQSFSKKSKLIKNCKSFQTLESDIIWISYFGLKTIVRPLVWKAFVNFLKVILF